MPKFDICIVGSGPAAMSCAIAAKQKGLRAVMLDKGALVNSIVKFPSQMVFFSTPDLLELGNIPFTCSDFRPTRKEAIQYYQRVAGHFGLEFIDHALVSGIAVQPHEFKIQFEKNAATANISSRTVIIATGFYDNPNLLNIPGENLPHVSHYYNEPFHHFGQDVVVVGGKNSAVEAALDLHRNGARVTLVHRKKELKESIKYWILPDIQNRLKEGSIKSQLGSRLTEIKKDHVRVVNGDEEKSIPAQSVYLLTGYHPNTDLLANAGVNVDKNTLIAEHDPDTLETTVPGVYIAGSIVAGRNSNRIFIENSREHGEIIIDAILAKGRDY